MGVNINTKPTIATIDNNDQIFISDDGVALKKVNYTDLAKAIIEQYNASQLAGSTKSVQTAINDLNENKMNVGLGEVIPNGANLNNYITIGTYRVTSSSAATSITNTPFDSPYMLDVRQGVNADTIIQEVLKHGALMEEASRYYNASNNTWTDWSYPGRRLMWTFNNTTTLISQAEALPDNHTLYFGVVIGYNHQTELDIPSNTNAYVEVYRWSENCMSIKFYGINKGLTGAVFVRNKYIEWGDWVVLLNRNDITTLNNKIKDAPLPTYYNNAANKNCDDLTEGFALCQAGDGKNFPTNSGFYYVWTYAYAKNSDKTVRTGFQIALLYNVPNMIIYYRKCATDVWSNWYHQPGLNGRKDVSVYEYSKSLTEGVHLYSTNSGVADNPTDTGSYFYVIYAASKGRKVIAISLPDRNMYVSNSSDSGTSFSAWHKILSDEDFGGITRYITATTKDELLDKIAELPDYTTVCIFAYGDAMKELTGDNTMTSNIKGIVTKTATYYDFVCGYYYDTIITGRYQVASDTFTWYKHPTRAEVDALESKSYTQVGTELATGQDLNNYKTPGVYRISSQAIANDTANIPQAQAGRLVVLPSSNSSYIFQEYYPYVAADRFYRRKFNDSWSQWYMYSPIESTIYDNAGSHNCVYRGKNLGTSVTEAQWAAIKAGTFTNMFIGDYWVIGGFNWRIAAFDYYLNCGDTNTTAHHVVIVPDTRLALCKMNSTKITTGAYIGSDFYTGANDNVGRSSAIDIVNSAFGSAHILSHRVVLTSATTNGYASSGTWYDATVELMTERMVYGNSIYENVLHGTNKPLNDTIEKSQFPLFALEHSRIGCRQDYWLRSVASSTQFCCVDGRATTLMGDANTDRGVRPAFAIYQA